MKLVTVDLLRLFLSNLKKSFVAIRAKCPEGFLGKDDMMDWGNPDGVCVANWYAGNGANFAFRNNNNSIDVLTTGQFYSNKGNNLVLDTGNVANYVPTKTGVGAKGTWNIDITGSAKSADTAKTADAATMATNDGLGRNIADTYLSAAGGQLQGDLHVSGDVYARRVHNAIYNDYAEYFERNDIINPGEIVALHEGVCREEYVRATKDSKVIIGVCSDEYAQIIGGKEDGDNDAYVPVALAGRVHVKVTGDVNPGDKIVISDKIGIGMADDGSGRQVLGIALTKVKNGKVRMLVHRG